MGMRQQPKNPVNYARRLNSQMGALPRQMRPANVGNINEVLWPFWLTMNAQEISAGGSFIASVTVPQDASFIWRYYMISAYETGLDGAPILLPGEAVPNTLTYSFQDGQSSRNFSEVGISMNSYKANFPYYLSTPLMFLPNSVIRANVSYLGGNPTGITPFITLFGYRLRIQGAENINSLVTTI